MSVESFLTVQWGAGGTLTGPTGDGCWLINIQTQEDKYIFWLNITISFTDWSPGVCVDSAGDILIFHNDVQTRLYLCDSSGCITLFMAIILRESIANSLIKICLNGLHYGLNVEPLFFSAKFSWQRNFCIQLKLYVRNSSLFIFLHQTPLKPQYLIVMLRYL